MSRAQTDREICKPFERRQSREDTYDRESRRVRMAMHGAATPTH